MLVGPAAGQPERLAGMDAIHRESWRDAVGRPAVRSGRAVPGS